MEKIFGEVLSMSVNSAWLIIAVIICRAFLQKAPKYFCKILWGLVGLRLVLPFSIKSALSLIPGESQQTTSQAVGQVVSAPAEAGVSATDLLPFIWVAVGVAFLIYGLISYVRLKLKIMDAVLLKENVYQSERVDSPFVCGFFKPKVYLPYGLDEITQTCVLQHEKNHIKNMDHIIKAVGFCVLCVHWFNPLVWVAYFLLCKDIELACDEGVIKNYDNEGCKQYAKALLELGVNKVKLNACPVAFGEVSIKKRIKSVIAYKRAGKVLVLLSLFLCTVVALCFMTDPEIKAKSNESKAEEVVEQVVEPTTEVEITEKAEETTEAVTEVVTEAPVEESQVNADNGNASPTYSADFVDTIEANKHEVREDLIRMEEIDYNRFNPFYEPETTDPMYSNAQDAGVFTDYSDNMGFVGAHGVEFEE